MAAAARGGCLPLIVGALDTTLAPVPNFAFLPYTESIDYCKVGFIVPLINGRKVPLVPEMLDALEEWQRNGGRLMYLGGNGFYWRVAFSDAWPGARRAIK